MRRSPLDSKHFRSFCLWFVGGCALFQLALGTAIDRSLPEVRDPEYVHREELLAEHAAMTDRPLVLVLGSSRVLNGVDARGATETLGGQATVFNFGIPTSGPFLERVCLERLIARGLKPDLLLMEVMPLHYNARRPSADLNSLDGARLAAGEVTQLPANFSALTGPVRRWLVGRLLPAYRHQAEIRARFDLDASAPDLFEHVELAGTDSLGWRPRSVGRDRFDALKQLAHQQYDRCYADFELSAEQRKMLEENLLYCREHGIAAALLLTPEGSEFRNLGSPQMEASIREMLAGLQQKYGVPVIDARDWMADGYFFDMHHLVPEGATVFSKRLAKEGIEPLLKDQRFVRR